MNYLLDIICRKSGVSFAMLKREQKFLMFRGLWIFVFLSILISCVSISKEYGYFPSNKDVEKLVIGKSNKGQIENLIGPATVLDRHSWIYVSSKVRSVGFLSPTVTDRNILLLKFSKEDVLLNFANEMKAMLSDKNLKKFPKMPVKGNLNLDQVKQSVFFCI